MPPVTSYVEDRVDDGQGYESILAREEPKDSPRWLDRKGREPSPPVVLRDRPRRDDVERGSGQRAPEQKCLGMNHVSPVGLEPTPRGELGNALPCRGLRFPNLGAFDGQARSRCIRNPLATPPLRFKVALSV